MSRLAKKAIIIPQGVTLTQESNLVTISGPKGKLTMSIPAKIDLNIAENKITLTRLSGDLQTKANLGTTWSILHSHIQGVVTPWQKNLEIRGTGYKFALKDNRLVITCGFIHPVYIDLPEGVTATLTDETKVVISGSQKEVVGQVGSNIRKVKPPEPYKGKGIRYSDESVKLKVGKTAKT
jgi:large subunit ribosomal protein L6